MSIGLTLSGGGFRATLFHLGVIQYLRQSGLLKQVTQVTSVSGGSVTAAHLAVNWDRYSGTDEQFAEAAKELIGFTQLGVRERVVAWLPMVYAWKPLAAIPARIWPWLRVNQSTMLRWMYDRFLFRNKSLGALNVHGGPQVNIAATNLSRPSNLVTFCGAGVHLHGPEGKFIDSKVVAVAHAVAASSAFPLLFPAVVIDSTMLARNDGILVPSPQFLTDGGVFDNYGLRALHELQSGKSALQLLIVSDAGARAGWAPNTSFSAISLLSRASAITGQRVSDLELNEATKTTSANKVVVVSIHDVVPRETPANLAEDLQYQLGAVRTDLNRFSNLLVHSLGSHGFAVARRKFVDAGVVGLQSTPSSWNPLGANNPTTDDIAADTKELQKEAFLGRVVFTRAGLKPLPIYAVVLGLALWFLPSIIVGCIDGGTARLRTFVRSSWRGEEVAIASNKFGDTALLGSLDASMSELDKDKYRMNRWLGWANDGIRPQSRREQVIVVESPEFDGYFRDMTLSVLSDRNVKFLEGVSFLVKNEGGPGTYHPVYRQMHMSFEPTGDKPPEVTLLAPGKGEKLIMILRAASRSPDETTMLPSNPTSFSIKLRLK